MSRDRITDRGFFSTQSWLTTLTREELEQRMFRMMEAYEQMTKLSQMRVDSRIDIYNNLHSEFDEAVSQRNAYREAQQKGPISRHLNSDVGKVKRKARVWWIYWQQGAIRFETKAAFAEHIYQTYGHPANAETVLQWIRIWERESA